MSRSRPKRFQGLENIHAVISRHEKDWRIANGEDPETVEQEVKDKIREINSQFEDFAPRRPSRIEARTPAPAEKELPGEPEVSREQTESEGMKLSADRFLSVSNEPVMTEESEELEPEISQAESDRPKFSADRFLGVSNEPVALEESEEHETASEADNEPEAAEIIPNKEGRHSWLYNEVMKAINDAAKGSSAKIIAVFIPVVQNGKEFEDLPADETVTTSPVDESLAKIEAPAPSITPENEAHENESPVNFESPVNELPAENESSSEDFNLIPEIQPEQKAEIAETFREMEEKLDELQEDKEDSEAEQDSEAVIISEDSEPEALTQDNAPDISPSEETIAIIEEAEPEISEEESAVVTEESAQEVFTDESESSTLMEESADDIDTLTEELEPEISADESEQETAKPEDETEYDDDDILQDGEPMEYEEISTDESTANESGHEELMLTDELDDDEIFDESLTEVRKADDDKAIIVEEDGIFIAPDDDDEIEIIPDPKR